MTHYHYDYNDLLTIQSIIERSAQSSLISIYQQSTASYKSDGSIVTDADLAMQDLLTQELAATFPTVRMLSEEIDRDAQLQAISSQQDYWCIDPLDGTTNYHASLPIFSVSLALISEGQVVLGVVYDPLRGEFFSAIRNQGIWLNNFKMKPPQQPRELSQSVAFIDFKRLPDLLRKTLVCQPAYKSQRNIGSCALEWAWLAAGRVQLIIHGSEKLWDYAAGCLLLAEAGGVSETHKGEAVFIESLETRSVVAASNPALFRLWSDWLKSH
ncbi:MAG: inositol monophosphatase family protein [Gammaproteobacteria bacterium]|nr:inositol monophosphatase family protein [Gammaproteobacteria bacterium]